MTIKDVARLAGVSASTVSRVINGGNTSTASAETQKRIWDAARAVGYVPNQNARRLRQPGPAAPVSAKRFDCIFARVVDEKADYFFEQLMFEIRKQAIAHGFQLGTICNLQEIPRDDSPGSHGGATIVLGRINEEQIKRLKQHYTHIVAVSLQDHALPVDQVISSGYDAVGAAIEYLNSLGHEQICYLGETVDEQRYEAYLNQMKRLGILNPESLVVETAFSPSGGYDAVKALLERGKPFTAILCADDVLALGVLKALKEHKLHVPRDVSVVGINDKEEVRYLDPMLTAVNIPIEEMGKHAAKLLIDRIEGGHKLPVKLILPNRLICRESCAPVKTG